MKKVILVSVLTLYIPMLPAAGTPSFLVISDHAHPIASLGKEDRSAWINAYIAIDEDNYNRFAAAPITQLVNKVSHIPHSASSIAHVMTLLEYLAKQESSLNRVKMINLLLDHHAHTRSTYGIGQDPCPTHSIGKDPYYQDHLPPIYYAIIGGNVRAFEALIHKDPAVSMRPAMDLWVEGDQSKNPSIKMFLEKLVYINLYRFTYPKGIVFPALLPAPEILDSMLISADRAKDSSDRPKNSSSSCIIE